MNLLKFLPLGVVLLNASFAADRPTVDQKAYCEKVIAVANKSYLHILELQKSNNDLRVFDDKLRTEMTNEVTPVVLEALNAVKDSDGVLEKVGQKKGVVPEFDDFSFAETWHRLYRASKVTCPDDFRVLMLSSCVRCPYDENYKRKLFLKWDGLQCLVNPGDAEGIYKAEVTDAVKKVTFGGGWDKSRQSYYFTVCSARNAAEARRERAIEVCYRSVLTDIVSGKSSKELDFVRAEVKQKYPPRELATVKIVPKVDYLKKNVEKLCWKYVPELSTDPVKVASEALDAKTATTPASETKPAKATTDPASHVR